MYAHILYGEHAGILKHTDIADSLIHSFWVPSGLAGEGGW